MTLSMNAQTCTPRDSPGTSPIVRSSISVTEQPINPIPRGQHQLPTARSSSAAKV